MLQNTDISTSEDDLVAGEPKSAPVEGIAVDELHPGDGQTPSLQAQMTGLVDDVRTLAHAEVEYYRAKLSVNMAATKKILAFFAIAIAFGTMAIIALILGVLLILAEYVGPAAATGITVGFALLVTAITGGMALKRAKKLPLDENDE